MASIEVAKPADDPSEEDIQAFIKLLEKFPKFTVHFLDLDEPPSLWQATLGYDILLTFARYTKPPDPVVHAFHGTKTTHVHVLEPCSGWNCTQDAFIQEGQVSTNCDVHQTLPMASLAQCGMMNSKLIDDLPSLSAYLDNLSEVYLLSLEPKGCEVQKC